MHIFQTIFLGIVEGATEFLPISSTAHLLIAQKLMHIAQSDAMQLFDIVVQLGAILAVIAYAPKRLLTDRKTQLAVLVAFVPTAIIGFAMKHKVQVLDGMIWVLVASLGFGGILMLLLEKYWKPKQEKGIDQLTTKNALVVGVIQSLAIIPGVSRSAATIYGGLMEGLERKEAVAYSFFLAIPTMVGASVLSFHTYMKSGGVLSGDTLVPVLIGSVAAFVTAYLVVNGLMRFIEKHGFALFGWYRVALAFLLTGALLAHIM